MKGFAIAFQGFYDTLESAKYVGLNITKKEIIPNKNIANLDSSVYMFNPNSESWHSGGKSYSSLY
jgi:hypothetical protein